MELAVIRHAVAEPHGPDLPDAERALTKEGRKKFRAAVDGMRALDLRFDRVLHSPLRRAVETADLLAPLIDGDTEVTDWLARPPGPELVGLLAGTERVALVGHEPWLSELVAMLVVGTGASSSRFILGKGSATLLEGIPTVGAMHLRALLPCRVLRRVGR